MNPASLVPLPDPLPVSWVWFQALLSSTFLLHLLAMNVMLGWVIIAFIRHISKTAPVQSSLGSNQLISRKLPFAIAFTINFGVAPLLFLQVLYGHLSYTSSVLMAVFWLSIIGLLILVYYAAYIYNLRFEAMPGLHTTLTGGMTLFLLIIAFFFTSNMSLMVNPESWLRYFDHPEGMLLNMGDSTLLPRYLHTVFASVAVGGLALGLYHDWQGRRGDQEAAAQIPRDLSWFSWATIINFGVGTWYFGGLPAPIRTVSGVTTALLLLFLIIGIGAAILSVIYGLRYLVRPATGAVLAAIICMVTVRELVRRQTLAPWFSPADLTVAPQYSPMLVFLLIFAAGLVLIWYMIQLVLPSAGRTQTITGQEESK